MNLIKQKGTLGIRGQAILCVVIGLLVSVAPSQAADSVEEELASLKVRLLLLENSYREMCKHYSNLAPSCSAPAFNCTECPDKWLHVGDQCFFLGTDRNDFINSEKQCEEMGGHLAILTNKEQHDAVEKEGRRLAGFYTHYWIGLTDVENEGEWKWVDNSTLISPHWDVSKNEPDNNKSGGEEGEDCAVVDSYNQIWYDVPCSFMYPRICQMNATPLG